jgi:hypothetical protein
MWRQQQQQKATAAAAIAPTGSCSQLSFAPLTHEGHSVHHAYDTLLATAAEVTEAVNNSSPLLPLLLLCLPCAVSETTPADIQPGQGLYYESTTGQFRWVAATGTIVLVSPNIHLKCCPRHFKCQFQDLLATILNSAAASDHKLQG